MESISEGDVCTDLDGVAVASDIIVMLRPVPMLSQDIIHQVRVRTRWRAIQRVIRTHDAADL